MKFNIKKDDIKQIVNALINMYALFAVIEIFLSKMRDEPYSIERILLYSCLTHVVACILYIMQKKENNKKSTEKE
jgi:uncharacterized membrane protein